MYTFHSHYYTPDRISLVATGCNHSTLVQLANKFRFSPLDCVYTPGFGNLKLIDSEPEQSKYKGGLLQFFSSDLYLYDKNRRTSTRYSIKFSQYCISM
jgi:hypothetical protein